MGIRSIGRDQGLVEYVVEIIFRFLMNLFIGLFANTVCASKSHRKPPAPSHPPPPPSSFVFYVWGVIKMYNADPVTSACFWLLCIIAAVSFLATCVFAMWSSVVLAVSGLNSVAAGHRRIRDTRD
jgi:hypothetical protein